MLDEIPALIFGGNAYKGPSATKICGIPVILRSTAGENLDVLIGHANARDILKRPV
jgi:hypothetical protein